MRIPRFALIAMRLKRSFFQRYRSNARGIVFYGANSGNMAIQKEEKPISSFEMQFKCSQGTHRSLDNSMSPFSYSRDCIIRAGRLGIKLRTHYYGAININSGSNVPINSPSRRELNGLRGKFNRSCSNCFSLSPNSRVISFPFPFSPADSTNVPC